MFWPLPITFTEILLLRNTTLKSPLSQSNHTLLLTLCSEFDAVLKTEIFLQPQLVDEKDRSCFSYSINTEATVQYLYVFTFFRLSCTLTYSKWIQTRGITFCYAIWKLNWRTSCRNDIISRHISHGLKLSRASAPLIRDGDDLTD